MLLAARSLIDAAMTRARSRGEERALGVRVCEIIELEELHECRLLLDAPPVTEDPPTLFLPRLVIA